jgi:hypothetical protein
VKIPEFYIEHGTERVAVEVKRIESLARIRASIEDARDKFAAQECDGALVIEVSDCLVLDGAESIARQVDDIAATATDVIWQPPGSGLATGFKPGFRNVKCLCVVARGAWRTILDGPPRLEALGIATTSSFAMTRNSMAAHRAERIKNQLTVAFDGTIARLDEY